MGNLKISSPQSPSVAGKKGDSMAKNIGNHMGIDPRKGMNRNVKISGGSAGGKKARK